MDGILGAGEIGPGEDVHLRVRRAPFGCHLYHCHSLPLKRHIHKGMYGAFVIDPDPARHPEQAEVARSRLLGTPENREWQEFVMVMNGFDTNFDGENEVYAVNTVAHHYAKHPITVIRSKPVRLYLVNVVEFDPINSLHLHGNFFDYYDHGTTLTPTLRTIDTVMRSAASWSSPTGARDGLVHVPRPPIRVHRTRLDGHVQCGGGRRMNDRAGPESVVASPRPPAVRPAYAFVLWIALPLFLLGWRPPGSWCPIRCAPSTTARRPSSG